MSGWLARTLLGVRWIAEFWDHPFLEANYARQNGRHMAWLLYFLRTLLVGRLARHADVVVCTGNAGMVGRLRIPAAKLIVSPNGADAALFQKRHAGETSTSVDVVYVGWIGKSRGVEWMLDAMKLLGAMSAPLTLTLVGPCIPHDREWVVQQQQELDGRVQLTGRLEHPKVLSILQRADLGLCLFPPLEELEFIYPIKIYEYMAMGVVPVCSDLTGVRDIVRNGVDGFLLKSIDRRELAALLCDLASHRSRLTQMKVAARKRAEQFRWDRIHARLNAELLRRLRMGVLSPAAFIRQHAPRAHETRSVTLAE